MNIPKSYEALAADLASEKILSKTLLGQKEAYMMIADARNVEIDGALASEAALLEGLTTARRDFDYDRGFSAGSAEVETLRIERDALQQRLTVAEQREVDLKKLLCDVINEAPTGFASLKVDLANRVNDALNPADHPQCEECKGWGYHENHHEGGGTECGECGGSGNSMVAVALDTSALLGLLVSEISVDDRGFYHLSGIHPNNFKRALEESGAKITSEVKSHKSPVAVVMPERMDPRDPYDSEANQWNACLDEVARLNGVKP